MPGPVFLPFIFLKTPGSCSDYLHLTREDTKAASWKVLFTATRTAIELVLGLLASLSLCAGCRISGSMRSQEQLESWSVCPPFQGHMPGQTASHVDQLAVLHSHSFSIRAFQPTDLRTRTNRQVSGAMALWEILLRSKCEITFASIFNDSAMRKNKMTWN